MIRRIPITGVALALCVLLALAGCGNSTTTGTGSTSPTATTAPEPTATTAPTATTGATGAATVEMGAVSFAAGTTVSIKAGQAVTFNDPSDSGGVHNLVTGTHGTFKAMAGAPSEFASSSGIMFNPGDSKTITFPTAGTFTITCTFHPSMLATITVTK